MHVTTTDQTYKAGDIIVPRVSTILGLLGGKQKGDALQDWAGRCALQQNAANAWRDELSFAARVGTRAHEYIESAVRIVMAEQGLIDRDDITPGEWAGDPVSKMALVACDNWGRWWDKRAKPAGFYPLATEVSLVSATLGYGGTVDCVAGWDGQLFVLDWKTSSRIDRLRHSLQLVAYAALLEEEAVLVGDSVVPKEALFADDAEHAEPIEVEGGLIVRADKKERRFEQWQVPLELFGPLWDLFASLVEVHNKQAAVDRAMRKL